MGREKCNSLILQTVHRRREHNTEVYFLYYQDLLIGSHTFFLFVSGMWRSAPTRQSKIIIGLIFRRYFKYNREIIGPLDSLNCTDLIKITAQLWCYNCKFLSLSLHTYCKIQILIFRWRIHVETYKRNDMTSINGEGMELSRCRRNRRNSRRSIRTACFDSI